MVEYDELHGGKCLITCLPYNNQRQVGLIFRQGSRNNAFMIPLKAARQLVDELEMAIGEMESGITE